MHSCSKHTLSYKRLWLRGRGDVSSSTGMLAPSTELQQYQYLPDTKLPDIYLGSISPSKVMKSANFWSHLLYHRCASISGIYWSIKLNLLSPSDKTSFLTFDSTPDPTSQTQSDIRSNIRPKIFLTTTNHTCYQGAFQEMNIYGQLWPWWGVVVVEKMVRPQFGIGQGNVWWVWWGYGHYWPRN